MPGLRFPKTYADCVARLRVPSGFLIVAAFVYFSAPDARTLAIGLPVSALGLLVRAWAAGHLAKNERLATSGPYAYVRNPLYIGTLLVACGLVIAAQKLPLALLFGLVFVFVYLPAIQLEEQHLRAIFPEYEAYAARVPALMPARPPEGMERGKRFRFELYRRNQEYQAMLGFVAGALVLLWKVEF
ncbi:MAG: isoprenylcysteine carboxylmethyltransferase family protein [Bryobacteraceae bacterium]